MVTVCVRMEVYMMNENVSALVFKVGRLLQHVYLCVQYVSRDVQVNPTLKK